MLKEGFKKKRLFLIFGISMLIIVVLICYFTALVSWGGNYFVFQTSPLPEVISQVTSAAKNGGTVELSEAEVNALVPTFSKTVNKNTLGLKVDGIYTRIAVGKIAFYIPCSYKGFHLMLFSQGTLALQSGNIVYSPDSFKIGELVLAKNYVMQKLSEYKSLSGMIKDQRFVIGSNNLPFAVNALSIKNNDLQITIPKELTQTVSPKQATSGKGSTVTSSSTTSKQAILRRASSQLGAVYSSVKTTAEKQIISKIRSVVNTMEQNASYNYQSDAAGVKSQYHSLSATEQSDIKNAIFNNMDMSTLREIRNTFGL